jgi:hypothetical protein
MTKTKRGNKGKKGTLNKRKKMNKSTRKQFGGYWFYPSREDIRREEQIQQMSTALNELIAENSEIKEQRKKLIYTLMASKILPSNLQIPLQQIQFKYEQSMNPRHLGDPTQRQEYMREGSSKFNKNFSIIMKAIKDYLKKVDDERIEKVKVSSISNPSNSVSGGLVSRTDYDSEERNSDITPSCFGGFCNNPLREPLIAK